MSSGGWGLDLGPCDPATPWGGAPLAASLCGCWGTEKPSSNCHLALGWSRGPGSLPRENPTPVTLETPAQGPHPPPILLPAHTLRSQKLPGFTCEGAGAWRGGRCQWSRITCVWPSCHHAPLRRRDRAGRALILHGAAPVCRESLRAEAASSSAHSATSCFRF